MILLSVKNLKKYYTDSEGFFDKNRKKIRAVDGVSFDIKKGEIFGLVGESGCGKSTVASTVLRIEEPTDGEVFFKGENIMEYSKDKLKKFRRKAQIIFQDSNSSLDPRMSIGESIGEPLRINKVTPEERQNRVEKLLELVGMKSKDAERYPHEFSGGQKQRISLARALSVNPDLIVADEPVSALDMSVQSEILSLIKNIQKRFGLSILFISHDMQVVRNLCDRIAVMYLGEIVEKASTKNLFDDPKHPYTKALLSSIPIPDPDKTVNKVNLSGDIPDPSSPPQGCRFHTRCPQIIQSSQYDLNQEEWRSIMDLERYLTEEGVEGLHKLYNIEFPDEDQDRLDEQKLEKIVRKEFEIPELLSDIDADSVFKEFIKNVANEKEDSIKLFKNNFHTVCKDEKPQLKKKKGRLVSCHLVE